MAITTANRMRYRAILIAREVSWLFRAVPDRWAGAITAPLWRALFLAEEGHLHRAGEIVLADLREFAVKPVFDPDPLVMARRAGRREVFDRIVNYLNLDEGAVQKIMQLDDGIGE